MKINLLKLVSEIPAIKKAVFKRHWLLDNDYYNYGELAGSFQGTFQYFTIV